MAIVEIHWSWPYGEAALEVLLKLGRAARDAPGTVLALRSEQELQTLRDFFRIGPQNPSLVQSPNGHACGMSIARERFTLGPEKCTPYETGFRR